MADVKISMDDRAGQSSILDDFCYNNNVSKANVYVRLGFLRKVYGILSIQLFATTMIAAFGMFTPAVKLYISQNHWMVMGAFLLSMALLLALMVKRRETPTNYFLLMGFTIVQAFTVAVVVSFYDQMAVLQAFLLTLGVTGGLTLYTFQSKRDFSTWGAGLYAFLMVLLLGSMLQFFLTSSHLEFVLSLGGAVLFSFFIIFDTHMLMHRVSPEEYILATIELYLDIINLFLHILRIIGEARRN
ncbi:protein lifeguard 4 [Rhipicephalus microplus]|uniref:Golgi antiapoptotic protein n=1 Tax=Rhipicephalus microplus TaxID=6941 RepID=A0A6M2CLB5_RHIMP|nr:protein lifeguard 4-like [Rhipicephalus microplus]